MAVTNVSECGRFVVVEALHLDRDVFDALARWAADHGLRIQDAIQLAVCAFNDRTGKRSNVTVPPKAPASSPEHEHRLDAPALGRGERIDG